MDIIYALKFVGSLWLVESIIAKIIVIKEIASLAHI
jgi:hypothetical protein